jgi:hypothetical protein
VPVLQRLAVAVVNLRGGRRQRGAASCGSDARRRAEMGGAGWRAAA